jgi:dTDP-4-dehydrorhamnose 3,5-epimerase
MDDINAAAFTAVDAAETPKGRAAAWKVNVEGVKQLARVAQEHRLTLVHMSSDYVFDGVAEEHDEDEGFTPLGVYGQTKAAADAIVSLVPHHYIVRSSWVIGDGRNFVRTMMALSRRVAAGELEQVTVVDDQRGRLTFTDEMAHAILWLLGYREGADMVDDRSPYATYGTYNLKGSVVLPAGLRLRQRSLTLPAQWRTRGTRFDRSVLCTGNRARVAASCTECALS